MRLLLICCISMCMPPALSQSLTPTERAQIDAAAREILSGTGAPSASIAIVRGGQIVYEQAYGDARLEPKTPAAPSMRYAIGSISKQFTAAAILLLAEDGKLSLADKVAKWFPDLAHAKDVTVRELLSMTAGYQDFWPQDYLFTDVLTPIRPQALIERWSRQLDFEPGTQWQYSNTNYAIAGQIIERVTGMSLMDFMRQRIFTPLKMNSATDVNAGPLGTDDAAAYLRHALGPLRLAPKEAPGWLLGAAHLAMTAHDLALWDISMIHRTVLRSGSYDAQQTAALLKTGNPTGYGLGVEVSRARERRSLSHSGAISGYTSHNRVYPGDRAAVVAFTNIYPGSADAPSQLVDRIEKILFAADESAAAAALKRARETYDGLVKGALDRRRLMPSVSAYFTEQVVADYATSLAALGTPTEFKETRHIMRGGMSVRDYDIRAEKVLMQLVVMTLPDGRYEQYLIWRKE